MTWAKFGKLCRRWPPNAKIIHPYPEERFNHHYPSSEPYAVILHVRICAGAVSNGYHIPRGPAYAGTLGPRVQAT